MVPIHFICILYFRKLEKTTFKESEHLCCDLLSGFYDYVNNKQVAHLLVDCSQSQKTYKKSNG